MGVETIRKNTFQRTETLLYNYNNFKASIKEMQAELNCLKESVNELAEMIKITKSKDFKRQSSNIIYFGKQYDFSIDSRLEETKRKISHAETRIKCVSCCTHMIDDILKTLKADPYIDIIRLKYFENLSTKEVAKRLMCNSSTVSRNKNRLVDKIKERIFSAETINEILFE